MEHCRSPDGVTSISVRPYYTMLSRVYLSLAMGFLVSPVTALAGEAAICTDRVLCLSVCPSVMTVNSEKMAYP